MQKSTGMQELLKEALNLLRTHKHEEAKALLLKAVEIDEYNEDSWLLLSICVTSFEDRQICLENVLTLNPDNIYARHGLNLLTAPEVVVEPGTPVEAIAAGDIEPIQADINRYAPTGGTLGADKLYIEREADEKLYQHCLKGDFCYVLTARQMGKSSLMVRTKRRLAQDGFLNCSIDLQSFGKKQEQFFYPSLLREIDKELKLKSSPIEWMKKDENAVLSPDLLFRNFLREIVLERTEQRIVVFLDEIDTLRSYPGELANGFFATIRSMYNARAEDEVFKRLSFVILGVAQPDDLMTDKQRTPFNIGERIFLHPFTSSEALRLATGLGLPLDRAVEVVNWVIDWTGGHPYLSQKVFGALAEQINQAESKDKIDQLVQNLFFNINQPDRNLEDYIAVQLTTHTDKDTERSIPPLRIMQMYYRVLSGRVVQDIDDVALDKPAREHLKLIGLLRAQDRRLVISNRIYQTYFDRRWIEDTLEEVLSTSIESIELAFREEDQKRGHAHNVNAIAPLYQFEPYRVEVPNAPRGTLSHSSYEQWAQQIIESIQIKPGLPEEDSFNLDTWLAGLDLPATTILDEAPLLQPASQSATNPLNFSDDDDELVISKPQLKPASEKNDYFDDDTLSDDDLLFDDFEDDQSGQVIEASGVAQAAPDNDSGVLKWFLPIVAQAADRIGRRLIITVLFTTLVIVIAFISQPNIERYSHNVADASLPATLFALFVGSFVGIITLQIRQGARRNSPLEERLARYQLTTYDEFSSSMAGEEEKDASRTTSQRILSIIDEALRRRTIGGSIYSLLQQANLKITPAELGAVAAIPAIVVYGLLFAANNPSFNLPLAAICFFVSLQIVQLGVRAIAANRSQQFRLQTGDFISLFVNALRAGYSVLQAFESIARDTPKPISTEFSRVVAEVQLGIPLDEALEHLQQRVPSQELDYLVTAINIQREVGGNLAEIIDVIGYTIRERIKMAKTVRLRLQPFYRLFFIIAAMMPILQWSVFSSYFQNAFNESSGQFTLFIAYSSISVLIIVAASISRLVRRVRNQAFGAYASTITLTTDIVIGIGMIALAINAGVPVPILIWLGVLLTLVLFDFRVIFFFLTLVFVPVLLFSVPVLEDAWQSRSTLLLQSLESFLRNTFAGIDFENIRAIGTILVFFAVVYFIIVFLYALFLIVIRVRRNTDLDPLAERIAQIGEIDLPESLSQVEMAMSFSNRVILPVSSRLADLILRFMASTQSLELLIQRAGTPNYVSPTLILILRPILMFSIIGLMVLGQFYQVLPLTPATMMLIPCTALMCYLLPTLLLHTYRLRRKSNIIRGLPNALDLLTICIEAGLSFDQAMGKVYEKSNDEISLIFGRILQEIQLGKPRREAIRDSALVVELTAYSIFAAAIIQADQLGVSISRTLRIQSDQVRADEFQRLSAVSETYNFLTNFGVNVLLAPSIIAWMLSPIIGRFLQ